MIRRLLGVLAVVAIVTVGFAIPNQIAFQGRITDDMGVPIDGLRSVEFSLYDVETGGIPIWTETQPAVEFRAGLFIVQLGSVVPIPGGTFTGETFYIQMVIGGEPILPRKPLTSVPYAYSAYSITGTDNKWELDGDDMYNLNPGNIAIGAVGVGADHRLEVHGVGTPGEKSVVGISATGPEGWLGTSLYGAYGQYDADNYGALGSSGIGIYARGATHAAYLEGSAQIMGNIIVPEGVSLVIDGDPGSDNLLMSDATGALYWGDATGIDGDDWGDQVVQTDYTLEGEGTTTSLLGLAGMGAAVDQILTYTEAGWAPQDPGDITGIGDNWGDQVVQVTPRLTGDGTGALPLNIAQMGATLGQVLAWDGDNWAPADGGVGEDDNYVNDASFEPADGNLTLTMEIGPAHVVNLDGRYVETGGDNEWIVEADYIYPRIAPTFHIEDDGDLNLGGRNLHRVNEISANTIDPVIKIDGILWRTFATDHVGQKTMVDGTYQLNEQGFFEIDMAQEPQGTNLWLFYRAVEASSIVVTVTPHTADNLFARVEGSTLIVGSANNTPNTKFSFRMSGNRYDFREMDELRTNTRTKPTDVYIDVDGGARYQEME